MVRSAFQPPETFPLLRTPDPRLVSKPRLPTQRGASERQHCPLPRWATSSRCGQFKEGEAVRSDHLKRSRDNDGAQGSEFQASSLEVRLSFFVSTEVKCAGWLPASHYFKLQYVGFSVSLVCAPSLGLDGEARS